MQDRIILDATGEPLKVGDYVGCTYRYTSSSIYYEGFVDTLDFVGELLINVVSKYRISYSLIKEGHRRYLLNPVREPLEVTQAITTFFTRPHNVFITENRGLLVMDNMMFSLNGEYFVCPVDYEPDEPDLSKFSITATYTPEDGEIITRSRGGLLSFPGDTPDRLQDHRKNHNIHVDLYREMVKSVNDRYSNK